MRNAGRPNARLRQPIVKPCCRPVAQIVADRGVNRRQHLKEHEHDAGPRERSGEIAMALDR